MSDPRKYTIGWIAALTSEGVGAEIFLDEKHESPGRPSRDDNNYTVGRIGRHNVVIVTLPDGEYGTAAAASVVVDMVRTFVNVNVCLMVGVGGGAPSKRHDVRLGDVVVGVPSGGVEGVAQYDVWTGMQTGVFQRAKRLNQPPPILTAAASSLQRATKGRLSLVLQNDIDGALDKIWRRKKYTRPPQATDRLYRSTFEHVRDPGSLCDSCDACGGHPASLELRKERRGEDANAPVVHYGLIASGNALIRNPHVRDELARSKGVACFEMETAGIANYVPCLAIRGICDYSDSHKNKNWQGYASMAAAAYAKNLILHIGSDRASVPVTRVGRH
ncbi:Phosphorylase superfamily [Geosmithia morbida]|uniref:Phosphorylase superfamily n=1 Tax=Geosmithia morbida TaxID=1094350 RepID=A0A9P5D4N0_9HYPO|nr:Phosphorylase superfamily [Geosmithia morbida]KAF4121654.1 Phosphorylase superfamily [Geosmithia morbida]